MINTSIVQLAEMFKSRDNPTQRGIQIGEVISALPDVKVKLGEILLTKDDLIFSAHLLAGLQRSFEGSELTGVTELASGHTHSIASLGGKIEFTDNLLKPGDEVIVIPSVDGQTYYVIDKGVRI